jgi:hypothetical protein
MPERETKPEVEIEVAEADLNLKLNALLERQPAFDDLQKRVEAIRNLEGADIENLRFRQNFIEKYFSDPKVFDQLRSEIEWFEEKQGKKPPFDEEEIEQRIRGAVRELVGACLPQVENFRTLYQDIMVAEERARWIEQNRDFVSDLGQLDQTYTSLAQKFGKVPEEPTFLTLDEFKNDLKTASQFLKRKRPSSFTTVINLAMGKIGRAELARFFQVLKEQSPKELKKIFGEKPEEKEPQVKIDKDVEIGFFEKGKEGEELMRLFETVIPRDLVRQRIRRVKVTNEERKFKIKEIGSFAAEYNHEARSVTVFRDGQSLELSQILAHEFGHSLYKGEHQNLLGRFRERREWRKVVFEDDTRITPYVEDNAQQYGARSERRFEEDFCDSFSEFLVTPGSLAEASGKRFWFMKHYMGTNFPTWDVVKREKQIHDLENLYFERVAGNYTWIRRKIREAQESPKEKRWDDLVTNQEVTPFILFRELPQELTCFRREGGWHMIRQAEGKKGRIRLVFDEKNGLPREVGAWHYEYNAENKLVRRVAVDGAMDIYMFDAQGKLLKIENRNKAGELAGQAEFSYPKKGEIFEMWQDKEGKVKRRYEYRLDDTGRVVEKIWVDNEGKPLLKISFAYGSQSELLGKRYEDGEGKFIAESKYSYSEVE